MEFLNNINYQLGNMIGLTLLDPQHFISLVMRFVINLVVVTIIARRYWDSSPYSASCVSALKPCPFAR